MTLQSEPGLGSGEFKDTLTWGGVVRGPDLFGICLMPSSTFIPSLKVFFSMPVT